MNFELDLSNYKGRTQVTYEEYIEFLSWYKKRCNIRVLKIKDTVRSRKVIDKKTKENVAATYSNYGKVGYVIYNNFYELFKKEGD